MLLQNCVLFFELQCYENKASSQRNSMNLVAQFIVSSIILGLLPNIIEDEVRNCVKLCIYYAGLIQTIWSKLDLVH